MMRIIASIVLKNEADRYLQSWLDWNESWWDELFVYDDQSTDDTISVCAAYTDSIVRRPDHISSFLDHEGEFRGAAWAALEEACSPTEEDWIFAIDADEFLCGSTPEVDVKWTLTCLARLSDGYDAYDVQIPEMWNLDPLMRRMDGYWGAQMFRPEYMRYRPDGKFRNKKMGCGSGPTYSYDNRLHIPLAMDLLHFGHARPEDRKTRYDRYMSVPDHGHSQKHISSIMRSPTLEPWKGVDPMVRFGR